MLSVIVVSSSFTPREAALVLDSALDVAGEEPTAGSADGTAASVRVVIQTLLVPR